jgi:hypothetical protein
MAVAAFGATSASAATEFGDNCVGNKATETEPVTLFSLTAAGDPLPLVAPSAGIITKWKVNVVPAPVSFHQTLKVLRQNGPATVLVVGEAAGSVTGGLNTFDTRIPVQTGDHLGLLGTSDTFGGGEEVGNLFCNLPGGGNNRIGAFLGSGGGPGATVPFVEITAEARVPVSASLEPDADNDGYGDETQDKCPQSAAAQTACPVIALSTSSVATKGLVKILVTASSQASVTVAGTAKLGKGKSATLKGGTQIVAPATIAKFTLPFSKKLKSKLKQLSSKQSLTLKVTATAPNIVGLPTTTNLKVKLKGQAKPKRKS